MRFSKFLLLLWVATGMAVALQAHPQVQPDEEKTITCAMPRYGFVIEIPQGSEIAEETDSLLRLKSEDMLISIYVEDRSTTSDEQIGRNLVSFAVENGVDLAQANGMDLSGESLSGAYINGRLKNRNGVLLAGLVGLDTMWGFIILIEYTQGREKEAEKVILSVKMKKQEE